ncbi:MAG: ammonium transporter [Pseudomonadales bacterium]|nr:ammonium transporter [Pseudomonadales bacterium]
MLLVVAFSSAVLADDAAIRSGDTAWLMTSTALVLFMTIPGLALFYAGMVRAKNALSVMMQCFAIAGLVSVLWVLYGYSFSFGGSGAFWGGLDKLFLSGVTRDSVTGTVPEVVFIVYQMAFAIITPAIIVGAFAERMKFSALLWFTGIWLTVVYVPVAHWVWVDGGWLYEMGVLDFAGGTVVHINAGVAGLVAALVLGPRKGYPIAPMPPNNLVYTVLGASILWVGWFGFNGGSALAADGSAGMAVAVTQISTAAAALSWMFTEWIVYRRPSILGIASGAVAGLVAITPAAGVASPMGALGLGAISGLVCFFSATWLKHRLGYDDSLDVFGVHAVSGILGALLTGVVASPILGGVGFANGITTLGAQVVVQLIGVGATVCYAGVVTFIILELVDAMVGLRVSEQEEKVGLDVATHNERAYNLMKS